jgi:2-amino-4-hydroxy-6-hydroxymethyldihydropteridine diphosphokinase
MVESIIALGSNVGDRIGNIRRAIAALRDIGTVTAISSVYETEPMYVDDQGWFLNAVVALETALSPRSLLGSLQSIETEIGRIRGVRYGPRVLDLDIVFYGALIVREPGLEIPHPRVAERLFVLAPLSEIRPQLVHPVLGLTVSQLLSRLKTDKKVVRRPDLRAEPVP